ncbi:FG-GAP repeat domain-containing protein [Streptomyces iconiensis]|uniref:VCBS repeat-containing protein n=1 Tax=Streptomyces iconiensis TaxID=1384038 RepID=A0ABT7A7F2_9ACTN|nr:VCBS repeat-containing protein [Streptomyces iconiensis]MDJ1137267.1 VCBS repeat-containing protein [Streptomyces iconiensis]
MRYRRAAVLISVLAFLAAACGPGGDASSGDDDHRQAAPKRKSGALGRPDFDGDGFQDAAMVVTGSAGADLDWVYGPVAVFRGSPDGMRLAGKPLVAGSGRRDKGGFLEEGFSSPLTADLDRDGRTDLVLHQYVPVPSTQDNQERGGRTVVFHGGEDGLSATPRTLSVPGDDPKNPFNANTVGDFDGDGSPDLYGGGSIVFGPFSAAGKPRAVRRVENDTSVSGPHATASPMAADFDRDGRSDLLVGHRSDEEAGSDDDSVQFFRGTPHRGLVEDSDLSERLSKAAGDRGTDIRAGADLDGDGYPDILPPGQGDLRQRSYLRGGHGGLRPGMARLSVTGSDTVGSPLLPAHVTGGSARNTVSTVHYGSADQRGHLQLTRLTAQGTTATMAHLQTLDMDTKGLPGKVAEPGSDARDRFAESLRVLDADHDGHDDVLAAAPFTGPHGRYGGFWYLPGAPKGLTTTGAHHYSRDELGLEQRQRNPHRACVR